MDVDTSIFKAYDIRGIYPEQLNEETAYGIGAAFSRLLQKENPGKQLQIIVSQDMRLSSPGLAEKVKKGVTDSGIDVVDAGLTSTPTFYFAVAFYGYDGGIQVSASHNPPKYNGMKMVRKRGVPISGENGINEIRDMVVANKFSKAEIPGKITEKQGILTDLVNEQLKGFDFGKIKNLKIVVDVANAMGTLDAEAIFEKLPCELVKLNFGLDGTFPVHEPDPLKEENLQMLGKAVVENKADLGIGIDGDADRYFFLDEKGEIIRQEILRGIMAQIELAEHPGATVCYDIRPGRITKDMIEAVGGKAVVTRVGHSLIKEKMLEIDAIFGGESSGHYFYKFPFGTFEAPAVLTTKFLEFVSKQNKPVSEIIKPYKKYFHSGEINSDVADKEAKMEEIAKKYADGNISHLDGVTVEYPDFWFNVRPSNTESKLRLNLEARSAELMEQKRDEVLGLIRG
jgi:phosphomannomutase